MKKQSSSLFNSLTHSLTHSLFIVVVSITAIVIFNFCSEKQVSEPNNLKEKVSLSKVNSDSTKLIPSLSILGDSIKVKPIKDKGGITQPDGFGCGTLDKPIWLLDYYQASPGKIVGIWPTEERWGNVNRLKQLRDSLGFNYILINFGWPYDNCFAAGYQPDHMLGGGINVRDPWIYMPAILQRPQLWGYYTDEPFSYQKCSASDMDLWRSFLVSNFPNSKIAVGENRVGNAEEAYPYVNYISCTRYENYPEDWDTDQKPLWTAFDRAFGLKFDMGWIGAHKDLNDYEDLIKHANSLDFKQLWLYQELDNTDAYSDNNIKTFSFFAWKWGWMRRFERQWIYTYECTKLNPCDCDPYNITDGWELVSKFKTSFTREVSYW